jgi:hypothetical protein
MLGESGVTEDRIIFKNEAHREEDFRGGSISE